nr:hypothetical protein [Tanacetum cinerariifolium]
MSAKFVAMSADLQRFKSGFAHSVSMVKDVENDFGLQQAAGLGLRSWLVYSYTRLCTFLDLAIMPIHILDMKEKGGGVRTQKPKGSKANGALSNSRPRRRCSHCAEYSKAINLLRLNS